MKSKKVLAGFLSVSMLSLSATTVFAANSEEFKIISDVRPIYEIMPISEKINVDKLSYFNSFTGVVKEITHYRNVEGSKIVLIENQEGSLANIIISKDSYVLDDTEISLGSEITGFYKADAPMLMIYPMQYHAEVVTGNNKDKSVKVDLFSKDLISADGSLKLKISDDTEIISQDGKAFEGELADRKLVVTYGISTRSFPAQTRPDKIVVLFEDAVQPTDNLTEEKNSVVSSNDSTKDITTDKEKVEVPTAETSKKDTGKTSIHAIAEALGFDTSKSEKITKYNAWQTRFFNNVRK
jgi:hypothetical protein